MLYLASREPRDSVRLVSRVGRRLPAHLTALGQVLLAQLTPDEVNQLLPGDLVAYTGHTITDHEAIAAELDRVRSRGWAFESEQGTTGVACLAVAVDYRIPATDAVSCSMPADIAVGAELERVTKAVLTHTQRLAATLRREGIR